jgi:hypothetical protein
MSAFDTTVEIPICDIPLLNRAGEHVCMLQDAPIQEVAQAIREKREEGWKFYRTRRDLFRGVVVVEFRR